MSWIPISQAAQFYQCTSRTIWRKIRIGKLSSKLSNGMRMVWLAEQVHSVSSHKHTIPKDRYMVLLFELFEGLSLLRMRFEGPLKMADLFDRCGLSQGNALASHENCVFFFENLDKCFRQIDQLLNTFELDQTIFRNIYRTLVILKGHWQEAGLYLQEERAEGQVKVKIETLSLFDHLIEQVRNLLLLCAQQSSTDTELHSVIVQKGILEVAQRPKIEIPEDRASHPQVNGTIFIASSKDKKKPSPKKESRDER